MRTAIIFALVSLQCTFAEGDVTILAAGAWSEPVAENARGNLLRGRVLICEVPNHRGTAPGFDTAIYLELQECSDFHGAALEVFCDMPTTVDAGPDNRIVVKGGCDWELRDSANKPIPNSPGGFSGGAPEADWVIMPCDSIVRLRASAYNGGRLKGSGFTIDLPNHHWWVIPPFATNQYFLSGTFIVNPPTNHLAEDSHIVWSGRIILPKVRIPVERL